MIANRHMKGFTLIEILLVLTIISATLYLLLGYSQQKAYQMRVDRTTAQMQQILNAGLSYYVANGQWPIANGTALDMTNNPDNLQINNYLPYGVIISNPWGGGAYYIYTDPNGRAFTVYTSISSVSSSRASSAAKMVAGSLPMASTTATAGNPPPIGTTPQCTNANTTCWVSASVNIPGQNLNNATAVNFTGTVRHGGCVPVPVCPVDSNGNTMTPQVQIIPVSVSGYNDPLQNTVYPITSFTAYARGPSTLPAQPPRCINSTTGPNCNTANTYNGGVATAYWRACLQIITQKGNVQSSPAADYGSKVLLMAITRCQISNEKGTSKTTAPTNIYSN